MQDSMAKNLYPYYVEARAWLVQKREEYAKQCEEYAKQGLRPQYCIHGVNQWVDYDCACWRCELDERSDVEVARDLARREWADRMRKQVNA